MNFPANDSWLTKQENSRVYTSYHFDEQNDPPATNNFSNRSVKTINNKNMIDDQIYDIDKICLNYLILPQHSCSAVELNVLGHKLSNTGVITLCSNASGLHNLSQDCFS